MMTHGHTQGVLSSFHLPAIGFAVQHGLEAVLQRGAELCQHAARQLGVSRVEQVDCLVVPLLLRFAALIEKCATFVVDAAYQRGPCRSRCFETTWWG